MANSTATAIEAIVLIMLMGKRINGIDLAYILKGVLKGVVAGLVMLAGLLYWTHTAQDLSSWLIAVGGVFIGIVLYCVMAFIIGLEEFREGIRFLREKLAR